MKQFKEKVIIWIDHGYGNIKTANHVFKTGVLKSDVEPLFTKNAPHRSNRDCPDVVYHTH